MNKIFYFSFLVFIYFSNLLNALEISCSFEEVYKNGETNNGFLLINGSNFRYEYFKDNLYGLILTKNELFYFEKKNMSNVRKTNQNKSLVISLLNIFETFPNISESYSIDGMNIGVKKNSSKNFIHRISIQSNKINMSIFFYDCKNTLIDNLFFKTSPVIRYYY